MKVFSIETDALRMKTEIEGHLRELELEASQCDAALKQITHKQQQITAQGLLVRGGINTTKALLAKLFPDEKAEVLEAFEKSEDGATKTPNRRFAQSPRIKQDIAVELEQPTPEGTTTVSEPPLTS